MNEPKKHHYVPECYLKPFVNGSGFLWKYDKYRNYVSQRFPSQVCYEVDANRIRTEEMASFADISDIYWIEKEAFKSQENSYHLIHRDTTLFTSNHILISDEKYRLFLKFLITIKRRNPYTRNELIDMYTRQYRSALYRDQMIRGMEEEAKTRNEYFDGGLENLVDKYIDNRANNKDWLYDKYLSAYLFPKDFKVIENIIDELLVLKQTILHAPLNVTFITSDNPGFVIMEEKVVNLGGLKGNFELYFPLSPSTCLYLNSSKKLIGSNNNILLFPIVADTERVQKINSATKSICSNFILGQTREQVTTI